MGRATTSVEVGLTVALGDRALVDKRVIVRATNASTNEPAPFIVLPLTQAEAGELVPAFSSGESAPFGARAASHRERASLLRFDQARLLNDRALELAPDFPPAFFDAAAPGMTCARLSGSEKLTLHHLHPARAHLAISLDVPRISAEVRSAKGVTKIQLVTDLIVIDADRRVIEVVSRGGMAVDPTHPAATVHFVEALPSAVAKTMLGTETVPPPSSKSKKKRKAMGPTGTVPIDPADVAEVRRMAALRDTAPGVDAGTERVPAMGRHGTVPLSPEQVAAVRRAGDSADPAAHKPKRTK
jgi:hypothetical protein